MYKYIYVSIYITSAVITMFQNAFKTFIINNIYSLKPHTYIHTVHDLPVIVYFTEIKNAPNFDAIYVYIYIFTVIKICKLSQIIYTKDPYRTQHKQTYNKINDPLKPYHFNTIIIIIFDHTF